LAVLTTEIGYTTPDRITVRGRDLASDLIGKADLVDMLFLTAFGKECSAAEKDMVNAILVTVMDHGLTPSALAARLTYTGAPEAPQAAVAAGLLGVGSVFVGAMSDCAAMLLDAAGDLDPDCTDDDEIAERAAGIVTSARAERRQLFGFGHNIHRHGDPRIPALRAVSSRNGYERAWWRLVTAIDSETERQGHRLPLNAAGAIAAMVLSMELPVELARGLALIGRCAGLIAHITEEQGHPIGKELWDLVLRQDSRNVLPGSPVLYATDTEVQ
jgi:citrate synthase